MENEEIRTESIVSDRIGRWQLILLPSIGPADMFQEKKGIGTATPTSYFLSE